jgi:hypothetical protein
MCACVCGNGVGVERLVVGCGLGGHCCVRQSSLDAAPMHAEGAGWCRIVCRRRILVCVCVYICVCVVRQQAVRPPQQPLIVGVGVDCLAPLGVSPPCVLGLSS